MHSRRFLLIAIVLGTAPISAQKIEFEVASIKPQTEVLRGARSYSSGNRFYRPNATLRTLVQFAYDLPPFRVVGGHQWFDSDLWVIEARASAPATTDEMRLMARELLRDRFRLATHVETREFAIYELHLARADGPLGPNIKPAAGDCLSEGSRSGPDVQDAGIMACGPGPLALGYGFMRQRFQGVPLSALAELLENPLRGVVTDKTGVSGLWDFELTFAAETGLPPPPSLGALARLPDAPPLSTALREQLGLKLESSRGPVDVLVIDSVERPAPD